MIIGDHTRNGGDVRPCNDLASYERYDVKYHGNVLRDNDRDLPYDFFDGFDPLSSFKEEFMEKVLALVERYLPDKDLVKDLVAFDHR